MQSPLVGGFAAIFKRAGERGGRGKPDVAIEFVLDVGDVGEAPTTAKAGAGITWGRCDPRRVGCDACGVCGARGGGVGDCGGDGATPEEREREREA